MILLIISIIVFILLGILPHILHCFYVDNYYIYDDKGEERQDGRDIKVWPNGKPDDFNNWKSYPCRKITKIRKCKYDWEFEACVFKWIGTVLSITPLLVAVIIACIQHTSWEIQAKSNQIAEHIRRLETNKLNLITYYKNSIEKDIDISSTNLPGEINAYNAEVEEFVVKIKHEQICLENPWVNIYYNPAYKDVDIGRIMATYIRLN